MAELSGRHALVTGASRGIGRGIALHLAEHGAVGHRCTGATPIALTSVQDEIATAGGTAHWVVGDLTDAGDPTRVVQEAEAGLGPIDVLVANAGGSPSRPQPVDEMSDEDFVAAIDLNLVATFRLVKAVLPGMRARRRGSIVTISSAAARRPSAHSPIAYAAAKAGVEVFTQDVALQAGPDGVRANCVAPRRSSPSEPRSRSRRTCRSSWSASTRYAASARLSTSPRPCSTSPVTVRPGSPASCST